MDVSREGVKKIKRVKRAKKKKHSFRIFFCVVYSKPFILIEIKGDEEN